MQQVPQLVVPQNHPASPEGMLVLLVALLQQWMRLQELLLLLMEEQELHQNPSASLRDQLLLQAGLRPSPLVLLQQELGWYPLLVSLPWVGVVVLVMQQLQTDQPLAASQVYCHHRCRCCWHPHPPALQR